MSDNQEIEPVDPVSIFYPKDNSEPLEKPTEEPEGENPVDDEVETETETEELESNENEEAEGGEETDSEVYELGGEQFTLEDIKKWKSGSMMQSDYTKKTQALSDDRKVLDTDRQAFEDSKLKFNDLSAELEVLVGEDESIDWAELREDDPDKYIEMKEKADKRKAKLAEVKGGQTTQKAGLTQEQINAESKILFDKFPNWIEKDSEGKPVKLTDEYNADMKMVSEYAATVGYSQEDLAAIQSSSHWFTLVDAAKFNSQSKKGSALKKKVKQAPKATKPGKSKSTNKKSASDVFYG